MPNAGMLFLFGRYRQMLTGQKNGAACGFIAGNDHGAPFYCNGQVRRNGSNCRLALWTVMLHAVQMHRNAVNEEGAVTFSDYAAMRCCRAERNERFCHNFYHPLFIF